MKKRQQKPTAVKGIPGYFVRKIYRYVDVCGARVSLQCKENGQFGVCPVFERYEDALKAAEGDKRIVQEVILEFGSVNNAQV